MQSFRKLFLFTFFLFFFIKVFAQQRAEQGFLLPSEKFNRQRFNLIVIGEAGLGAIVTLGLEYLWYKKFPKSRFHFFNDNNEWLNMDKVGHATTAYNIAAFQYNVMRWSGVKKNSSLLIGGGTALAFMSMIEIMDGFSTKWGFSKGDMLANCSGTAFFIVQQSIWQQQKIQMQFSYHNTIYPKYNPQELGKNLPQRMLKDYNGQSYWLSVNISAFLKTNTTFPRYINADIGYGADGMTGAVTNPTTVNDVVLPVFARQRKLFLSLSGQFVAKNGFSYSSWLNIFKIPSPVLEYQTGIRKLSVKPVYF